MKKTFVVVGAVLVIVMVIVGLTSQIVLKPIDLNALDAIWRATIAALSYYLLWLLLSLIFSLVADMRFGKVLWMNLWTFIPIGLLLLFGMAFALREVTISVPFQKRETLLSQLNVAFDKIGYQPQSQAATFLTFRPSSRSGLLAGNISVQIAQSSATMVGSSTSLKKLRRIYERETNRSKVTEKVKLASLLDPTKLLEVEAVIEPSTPMLVLPQNLVDELHLKKIREGTVQFAKNQRRQKSVYAGLLVEIKGRVGNFEVFASEEGTEPQVGQIVLEALDLVVEPSTQTLTPRGKRSQ